MARMKFYCDAERCIECNGCVTACKNENEVPWGVNRRRVVTIKDGVPGERSNMAPPTLCIVALVLFQAGVAEAMRPAMQRRLERPRWQRANETINRFSMPLFLFHTTGMALERAARYALAGEENEAREPTLGWWLYRPLAFVGPLLFTLPVIFLFGRRWVRSGRRASATSAA